VSNLWQDPQDTGRSVLFVWSRGVGVRGAEGPDDAKSRDAGREARPSCARKLRQRQAGLIVGQVVMCASPVCKAWRIVIPDSRRIAQCDRALKLADGALRVSSRRARRIGRLGDPVAIGPACVRIGQNGVS